MNNILKKINQYIDINALIITITLIIGITTIVHIGLDYNKELIEKNNEYKKILQAEFGTDFINYNEYLVYKIKENEK